MHINGLVQDCSKSIANALEVLQSCTKISMYKQKLSRNAACGQNSTPLPSNYSLHHQAPQSALLHIMSIA